MSESHLEVQVIKGKTIQTHLANLLKSYTKAQLTEVAEKVNTQTKKSWKKDKLIATLYEGIVEQASTIYEEIIEEVLTHLPDTKNQAYRLSNLEDIKAFVPLIQKGFFFVSKEKNDYIFIIPDEIKDLVQVSKEQGIPEEHKERSEKEIILNEWKDRQLSIFGSYSPDHLKTIWNRYYGDDLTADDVLNLL